MAEAVEKLADIGKKVAKDARQVSANLKEIIIGKANSVQSISEKLDAATDILERVVSQTMQVLSGNTHIKDRIVSVFDLDARPISKGKFGKPTEFGYKVQVEEAFGPLVTGYKVFIGNPGDATLLEGAIERHNEIFQAPPEEVAADRGYSDQSTEQQLKQSGVKHIAIPRRGYKSQERKAEERKPYFKRLQRWRAGGEARISLLKRKYGLGRSLYRGFEGTRSWVAEGVFAHNLRMAQPGRWGRKMMMAVADGLKCRR